ncbi:MAG: hypothetical protein OEV01_13715, partial [Nitrospira sp.]|nr:hypothetical protein [Nitrospira sp.]MDH4305803.1 hypothetical protein [Nitrospira sp.]
GDCSPSRNVVSKILIMRAMSYLQYKPLKKSFRQGRKEREPRGVRVVHRGVRTTENAAGRLFQRLENRKALIP